MKRIALLLFALPALSSVKPEDVLRENVIAVEVHWNLFTRKLFGCPVDISLPADHTTCKLSMGQVDYHEYNAAREAAKILFKLRD